MGEVSFSRELELRRLVREVGQTVNDDEEWEKNGMLSTLSLTMEVSGELHMIVEKKVGSAKMMQISADSVQRSKGKEQVDAPTRKVGLLLRTSRSSSKGRQEGKKQRILAGNSVRQKEGPQLNTLTFG